MLEYQEHNKPLRDKLGRILPGFSGNLKGRHKKDQSIVDLLREKLKETCDVDKRKTWLSAIVDAELRDSLNDVQARKNLIDRLCGKAVDSLVLSGRDGQPLKLVVVWDNADEKGEPG